MPKRDIDVWDLTVWAIRDQRADRADVALFDLEAEWAGRPRQRRTTDGCATIARIGAVGTAIDGGGVPVGVAPRLHPDASIVESALTALPWRERSLILLHAKTGDPPEWFRGGQSLIPQRSPDAKHKVSGEWEDDVLVSSLAAIGVRLLDPYGRRLFKDQEPGRSYRWLDEGKRRQVLVRYCPLDRYPDDSWVVSTNDCYDTWHNGMTRLAETLRTVAFKDFRVKGFFWPKRPA